MGTTIDSPSRARVKNLLNKALLITGRSLITLGLLMVAFVAYQLWGTGVRQSQSQQKLGQEYTEEIVRDNTQSVSKPDLITFNEGKIAGKITIPVLGVDQWLVMGVRVSDLNRGPGIFTTSALPGQLGNLAIAGHRTSHGAPFENIDKLKTDDSIIFTTRYGTFTYKVTGREIISPNRVDITKTIDPTRAVTTLITCHPKHSTSKRLVVHAALISEQTPEKPIIVASIKKSEEPDFSTGWFHDPSRTLPTASWSAALLVLWWIGRKILQRFRLSIRTSESVTRKTWETCGAVLALFSLTVLFGLSLYFFFENLSGLLPTNI